MSPGMADIQQAFTKSGEGRVMGARSTLMANRQDHLKVPGRHQSVYAYLLTIRLWRAEWPPWFYSGMFGDTSRRRLDDTPSILPRFCWRRGNTVNEHVCHAISSESSLEVSHLRKFWQAGEPLLFSVQREGEVGAGDESFDRRARRWTVADINRLYCMTALTGTLQRANATERSGVAGNIVESSWKTRSTKTRNDRCSV